MMNEGKEKKPTAIIIFGEISRRQVEGLFQPYLFPYSIRFSDLLHGNMKMKGK